MIPIAGPVRAERRPSATNAQSALSSPSRRKVFLTIMAQPGIRAFHVWKEVGGALGVTMRAIARLERAGLIRGVRIGRARHFFPAGPENEGLPAQRRAALTIPWVRATLDAVMSAPPRTLGDLAAALGRSRSTVSERLKRLTELGLLEVERDGALRRYRHPLESSASGSPASVVARPKRTRHPHRLK